MTRKEKLESLINGNFTEKDIKVRLVYPKSTRQKQLRNISTYELVEELKKRAGVEVYQAETYEDKEVKVNGPAQILVVVD